MIPYSRFRCMRSIHCSKILRYAGCEPLASCRVGWRVVRHWENVGAVDNITWGWWQWIKAWMTPKPLLYWLWWLMMPSVIEAEVLMTSFEVSIKYSSRERCSCCSSQYGNCDHSVRQLPPVSGMQDALMGEQHRSTSDAMRSNEGRRLWW